ncbi:MAG: ABC transporter ATP-binding protein [archaeon]|nr:ABC transporter ATP-binding protein [archaeon]
MDFAIKMTDVRKDYGTFSLKDFSLEIPRGYVTGLIGSNGAGKSTMMKCITGAVIMDSGNVEMGNGMILKDFGVVFDECPFPQYIDCLHLSTIFGKMFDGWDQRRYLELLSKYGIDQRKKVKDLSRGMSMKLQIAVAFSHPTRFLMLDEPTAGMDPASRDEFLDDLREYMQDEDHTILISSHITTDLEKVADYIVFINGGEMMVQDEKDRFTETYGIVRHAGECPLDRELILSVRHHAHGSDYLVGDKAGVREAYPELVVDDACLEDIMVMIARGSEA